jgi:hypothetical protein
MLDRSSIAAVALAAALSVAGAPARADDAAKYPDWKGQWVRIGAGTFDPSKPGGRGQQPPLTDEYRAIWDAALANEAAGGEEHNPQASCLPPGMPRSMVGYEPLEIIVSPGTTYIMLSYMSEFRRIYTDGRDWPKDLEPSFSGYSIGKWEGLDGDGRYQTLVVETRGFKGPRVFEASGIPLHKDNETVVQERISRDNADPNVLVDEITTIDHALTRPWTVTRKYRRAAKPNWVEYVCNEDNHHVIIGTETYVMSADGQLMPTKKDQAPPDLRYFNPSQK